MSRQMSWPITFGVLSPLFTSQQYLFFEGELLVDVFVWLSFIRLTFGLNTETMKCRKQKSFKILCQNHNLFYHFLEKFIKNFNLWNIFLDSSDPGPTDVGFLPFFCKKTKSYLFHYNKIHETLKQVSIETCKKK